LGLGTVVQSLVLYQMDLGVDSDAVQLSTWRGLLDVSLLFYSWLAVLFADFLFSLPQLLFTVYYTEPSVFPIETTYELMHDKCLHNAISCNAHPLLQYLACLDLCRLSKFSPVRRQQVFSLSCLGGQPANWINIRTSCLEQLNCFIDSLISYGSTAHSDSLGTSYVGAPPVTVKAAGAKFAFPSSGLTPRITGANYSDLSGGDRLYTNLGTPVPVGDVTGMKTLTHRHIGKGQTASPPMQPPMEGRPQGIFSKLLCNFLVKVHQQRIIAYLVQETPENASRHLFADAQKYIFIVDGLSHIVCASLTEDMYGVVQSSLSVILSTLLDMLEAVDKHLKLCPISLRRPRLLSVGSAEQLDVVLRFALRASIKSAIYRIVATFRHHLNSVDLSIEHRRRLCSFEEFRE
jgi:nucleoporin NDC1